MKEYPTEEEWWKRGLQYMSEEKYTEAVTCFQKSLSINPKNFIAWMNKGISFARQDRHQAAIECYDEALKLDPNLEDVKDLRSESISELKDITTDFSPDPVTKKPHSSFHRSESSLFNNTVFSIMGIISVIGAIVSIVLFILSGFVDFGSLVSAFISTISAFAWFAVGSKFTQVARVLYS